MCYERTDMAIESAALFNKSKEEVSKINGVIVEEEIKNEIHISKVKITDQNGAEAVGKPVGEYITIDIDFFMDKGEKFRDDLMDVVSHELKKIINIEKKSTVFVIGLGNEKITPDALGPKVVDNLNITRHLFEEAPVYTDENTQSVCAISPGVLGITGIETVEVIKGISDRGKPGAVICIDALATRSIKRLSSSIQISDTGITPGAGVGNRRHTINYQTIGVPVIALGVPTVVDGATIANDSIRLLCDAVGNYSSQTTKGFIEKLNDEDRYSLVKEILRPYGSGLIVTPKDIDSLIEDMAIIIASSINRALGNE